MVTARRYVGVGVLLAFLPLSACTAGRASGCGSPDSSRAGAWPNEPSGLTVVSDVPFCALNDEGWKGEGSGLAVVADSTEPRSPRSALAFAFHEGFTGGLAPGVEYYDLQSPTPETYFGFWWKPSDPWHNHPSGVNKIALLFPITSSAGTIYIMMFHDGRGYTIQVETTFENDTRRLEPNVTATPVVLGRWHQIEWYVRYSTTPTSRDGVVRWWLDGVLQGAHTDLQMPPDDGFGEYTIRPVWGGVGERKRHDDYFWYGHAHISRR